MTGLGALIRRNSKLYFKDKGMFFTSLITPMILLVLYVTFLSRTYEGSFRSALAAAGAQVEDSLLHGCVGGQLISSLLAVSCVTVAFCSNLTMVFDKVSGARNDLTVSPVRPAVLSLSYYLATFCTTLLINGIAAAACFGYLALTGWYLSAADVLLVLLDVVILVLFGTALSSCMICPFRASRPCCRRPSPSCRGRMGPPCCAAMRCGACLRRCAASAFRRRSFRASATAWTAISISLAMP